MLCIYALQHTRALKLDFCATDSNTHTHTKHPHMNTHLQAHAHSRTQAHVLQPTSINLSCVNHDLTKMNGSTHKYVIQLNSTLLTQRNRKRNTARHESPPAHHERSPRSCGARAFVECHIYGCIWIAGGFIKTCTLYPL